MTAFVKIPCDRLLEWNPTKNDENDDGNRLTNEQEGTYRFELNLVVSLKKNEI